MRVRGEISKNNRYWIEKHRYYELKHYCLQYPIWKKAYAALDGYSKASDFPTGRPGDHSDPTLRCVIARENFAKRIGMVEDAAKKTDEDLGKYVLLGVTEGLSYDILLARHGIPCCKDVYYDLYRKFFWILNSLRD